MSLNLLFNPCYQARSFTSILEGYLIETILDLCREIIVLVCEYLDFEYLDSLQLNYAQGHMPIRFVEIEPQGALFVVDSQDSLVNRLIFVPFDAATSSFFCGKKVFDVLLDEPLIGVSLQKFTLPEFKTNEMRANQFGELVPDEKNPFIAFNVSARTPSAFSALLFTKYTVWRVSAGPLDETVKLENLVSLDRKAQLSWALQIDGKVHVGAERRFHSILFFFTTIVMGMLSFLLGGACGAITNVPVVPAGLISSGVVVFFCVIAYLLLRCETCESTRISKKYPLRNVLSGCVYEHETKYDSSLMIKKFASQQKLIKRNRPYNLSEAALKSRPFVRVSFDDEFFMNGRFNGDGSKLVLKVLRKNK